MTGRQCNYGYLYLFKQVIQRTALREVDFSLSNFIARGPTIAGPEGLESISIGWNVGDGDDLLGSSELNVDGSPL